MVKGRWEFDERENLRGKRSFDNLQSDEERRWNICVQSTKYSEVGIRRCSTNDILPFAL